MGPGPSGRRNQEGEACDRKALVHLGYLDSSLVLEKLGGSWGVWKASPENLDLIPGSNFQAFKTVDPFLLEKS